MRDVQNRSCQESYSFLPFHLRTSWFELCCMWYDLQALIECRSVLLGVLVVSCYTCWRNPAKYDTWDSNLYVLLFSSLQCCVQMCQLVYNRYIILYIISNSSVAVTLVVLSFCSSILCDRCDVSYLPRFVKLRDNFYMVWLVCVLYFAASGWLYLISKTL